MAHLTAPKPEKLFISYVPLLGGSTGIIKPLEEKQRVLDMLLEASQEYVIDRVEWAQTENGTIPVLILPYAKEIQNHMLEWSDYKPKQYFSLVWNSTKSGELSIILLPNFGKAVRRYSNKYANKDLLMILGHIFTFYTESCEGFRREIFSEKNSIEVGFSATSMEDFVSMEMKVCHITEINEDESQILQPYLDYRKEESTPTAIL